MESDLHQKIIKPWGSYETIQEADTFKVKRIEVNPGGKLSLQSHKFRSEHWIVVNGTATVTLGKSTLKIHQDKSIYIPLQEKHCIENKENVNLILIEVQYGTYLGEDDIFRYEDIYGRET
jgi:mannose-1-phosphate guanylyltransferase / mannose-6-phosphate isomerase